MNRRVPVGQLELGMYIAELDRPWLDTPFLVQGFLLDDAEQLVLLRKYCEYVYYDPYRSTGSLYEPRPRYQASQQHEGDLSRPLTTVRRTRLAAPLKRPSLLGELKTALRETLSAPSPPGTSTAAAQPDEGPLHYYYEQPARRALDKFYGDYVAAPIRMDYPLLTAENSAALTIQYVQPRRSSGLLRDIRELVSGTGTARRTARTASRDTSVGRTYGDIDIQIYDELVPVEREAPQAEACHANTSAILAEISENLRKDMVLDVDRLQVAVESMVESMIRNPNAMIWLTRLKDRDNYAYSHAIDTSVYLIAFGRHLGFPKEQMHILGIAGLLLDIGKIRVPEELLRKTGVLSEEEFTTLRSHVNHSIDILHNARNTPYEVIDAVATHHERLDGSGYPRGLRDKQIGMLGAMAGIVDTFEAMTSERPYAPAMSAQQALQEIYGWRDTLFPGALIEHFIQCIGIFPAGSIVELNSGDVSLVVTQNRVRKLKPKLLMVLDPNKQPYPRPWLLDLMNDPKDRNEVPYHILGALPPGAHGIDPKHYYL